MDKKNLLTTIIVGALAGGIVAYALPLLIQPSQDELIAEFYDVETATHVSPHGLRKHIADDEFVIVDLRSQEEYEAAHVIGAYSIPAYASPDKSAYGDVERITNGFLELREEFPGKDIVVYCYSGPCMTGRKIGKMLADQGIYVMHLGIGWQEWRYYWNLWNHDGETKVNPSDYIWSGPERGVFVGEGGEACPIGGEFGC